jgi:hypothetical protein
VIPGDNNIEKFNEAKLLGMPNPHYTSKNSNLATFWGKKGQL